YASCLQVAVVLLVERHPIQERVAGAIVLMSHFHVEWSGYVMRRMIHERSSRLETRDPHAAEHAPDGGLHLGVDFAGSFVHGGQNQILEHFDIPTFYRFG